MSHNIPITATQLAQSAHVSKETGNQLALVTDPYHDYTLTATGFPDGKSVYSVVKRRNGRATITCPFTLSAGQTWDFQIFTTPLHDYVSVSLGFYQAGYLNDTASGTMKVGPVNVVCRQYDNTGLMINAKMLDMGAIVDVSAAGAFCRTVSLGFELHDTSATLDKQGSISVYRLNDQPRSVYGRRSGTPILSFPHDLLGVTPKNLTEIMINPTCHTWELRHGVYSVSLPPADNEYHADLLSSFVLPIPILFGGNNCVYLDAAVTTVPVGWSPLMCTGAMSSKLTNTAVNYLVDFRQIVELIPDAASELMMYSTVSPEFNNQFMKLYKAMIYKIPSGTKVNNNASGDWFRAIAGIARTVAPMITQVLPPQAKAIAALAAPLANHLLNKVEDKIANRNSNKKSSSQTQAPKKNG